MKAVVCKEHGLPDKLELVTDWPEPTVGEHDVLIDVKAAGLNFPDVLMIQGKYQYQPEMPFIPGGECAGVVAAVGAKVSRFKVGDKVLSAGGSGAFCQKIAVNELGAFPMPDGLSFEQAAGVSITYFTSYYALKQRANLQPGETLLVLGAAGGVGTSAIELGKHMGAKVIAAASTDEKLALCKKLGADEVINYSNASLKDAIKDLTGGKGVDVVYDPVGGDYAEPAIRGMAWNGRLPGDRFRQRPDPQNSAQPDAAQGLLAGGRVLGTLRRRGAAGQSARISRSCGRCSPVARFSPVVTDCFPDRAV